MLSSDLLPLVVPEFSFSSSICGVAYQRLAGKEASILNADS